MKINEKNEQKGASRVGLPRGKEVKTTKGKKRDLTRVYNI